MVIVEENREYDTVIGNSSAPYFNELAHSYLLATHAYARAHPSLPNYLELVAGTTAGITDDCTSCTVGVPMLGEQLTAAGHPWRAYLDGLPQPCFTGASGPGGYAKKHDPFMYFPAFVASPSCAGAVVPLPSLMGDLAAADPPQFVFVAPGLCNDGHDCSTSTADGWLAAHLPPILASPWYRAGGAVVITWDEGTSNAGCCGPAHGGHIATIVVSAATAGAGEYATPVTHAGLLRSIEARFGLAYLGEAADPAAGTLPLG